MQGTGRAPGLERFNALVRSSLASLDVLAEERNRLLDAFKHQWNDDVIIKVRVLQYINVALSISLCIPVMGVCLKLSTSYPGPHCSLRVPPPHCDRHNLH